MPVGEIAEGALGAVARFIGWLLVDLLFEVVIQGTGRLALKVLRPAHEPGDTAATVMGLAIWAGLIGTVIVLSRP